MHVTRATLRPTRALARRSQTARARSNARRNLVARAGADENPYVDRKAAAEAARKALQGALGNKRDVLARFDRGGGGGGPIDWFFGGGGGGDDGSRGARRIAGWMFLAFLVLVLFKPVTAILVNAVYYAFGWRTGREAPTEAELAAATGPADANVIAKYAADDDDDDDDDDDE